MVLLPSGNALIVGGYDKNHYTCPHCLLFNMDNGDYLSIEPMKIRRGGFTCTVLPDLNVLVTGGHRYYKLNGVHQRGNVLACEIYRPVFDRWVSAGTLNIPRENHTCIALSTTARVFGGDLDYGQETCEEYDYKTRAWTVIPLTHVFL